MAQNNNILQELKELGVSLPHSLHSPYQVPAAYFERLADQVLARIKALEADTAAEELNHLSPLLGSISKKNPYNIPSDYFNSLEERISTIAANTGEQSAALELEQLSPLLSGLKKEMPYSIPEGYFENIIPAARPRAKVVSITRKTWFRYAAAAMITGLIVTAGFLIFRKPDAIDPNQKSYTWVEKNVKNVSTNTIEEFVDMLDEQTPVVATIDKKTANDIKELMKDVSDKEIENFLEETQPDETNDTDDIQLMD